MEFRKYLPQRHFQHFITSPFIYMMIIPSIFLDICLEIYHRICFLAYGLTYIERGKYIRVDRHKLEYLNLLEKLNCIYCGYVNGLFHYASVIASETEKYWCGIMHNSKGNFVAQDHHKNFLPYGDRKAFREFLEKKKTD